MGDVNIGPASSMPVNVTNFQSDTTNAAISNGRMEIGWGIMTVVSSTLNYTETVTFGKAFNSLPIVLITSGGDALTASGTAYGTGGNVISGQWWTKAYTITTGGFTARLDAPTGGVTVNGFLWYQWIAIGN